MADPGSEAAAPVEGLGWGHDFRRRSWWRFRWSDLLWLLIYPRGGQRILPTTSGTILIVLALGIGMAAYNTANNILFVTLSLLLACLILSGLLSWLNFRGLRWRILLTPPFRAGRQAVATAELANLKRWLPSYGLWFDFTATPAPAVNPAGPGRRDLRPVREILAGVGKGRLAGRVNLRGRLSPVEEIRLDWTFLPTRRGRYRFSLEGVGSLFPFGFLRKQISSGLRHEFLVWPAPVAYQAWGAVSTHPRPSGAEAPRAGSGGDLLALRRYEPGDSHRLIHWKASARMRQLLVRQYAEESHDQFWLWVRTSSEVWDRPEPFELMLSLAATLAEDLFRMEKLRGVALDHAPARAVNRVRDLEAFLDQLALAQPQPDPFPAVPGESPSIPTRRHLLTFVPDGRHGVAALADGRKTATA